MFTQKISDQLFTTVPAARDLSICCLVLPSASDSTEISFTDAFQNSGLSASFVFLPKTATPTSENGAAFVAAVLSEVKNQQQERAILWANDPAQIATDTTAFVGLSKNGSQTTTGIQSPKDQPHIIIGKDPTQIALTGNALTIGVPGQALFNFDNVKAATESNGIDTLTLDFEGPQQGQLRFTVDLAHAVIKDKYQMGFQQHIRVDDTTVVTQQFPFAEPDNQMIRFSGSAHPMDIDNALFDPFADTTTTNIESAYQSRVTYLNFTGQNADDSTTVFNSFYRTIFGKKVQLLPVGDNARLLLTKSSDGSLYLSPEGAFTLQIEGALADQVFDLMGGLHGAEFFSFRPKIEGGYAGDQIRFVGRQPALAPVFPFPEASPLNPPIDPTAPLLTKEMMTSWATLAVGGEGGELFYVAQPRGAALYGIDEIVTPVADDLLGHVSPGYSVQSSTSVSYPLLPYAGTTPATAGERFDEDEVQDFEFMVIAPVRRDLIGPALQQSSSGALRVRKNLTGDGSYTVTNPNGVLIEIKTNNGGSVWQEILIGQSGENVNEISFVQPTDEVQQAFQNGSLFLVATNPAKLGGLASDGASSGAVFKNSVTIGGWALSAEVGQNDYADYTNIVLFKGRKGKIFDENPANSLVANPGKWTQAGDFSSPVTRDNPSTPDDSQLSVLSNWLQQYCAEGVAKASNDDDPEAKKYFAKFKKIVTDPNWQGMLILRMTTQFPDDLIGLKAGITDLDAFYAHHFGIAISKIKKDGQSIVMKEPSAMFGLIYYEDPDFVAPAEGEKVQPVAPETTGFYDFRLLTLKVLFENSAIKYFESFAQLTVDKLFEMPVQGMGANGNPFHTLVLRGSYQDNNGQPVYSLGTDGDYSFLFDSNIFNKIELTSAKLLTRTAAGDGGENVCWFALSGYLDFLQLEDPTLKTPFDILSFGIENGDDPETPRKGLRFHNLGIEMRFSTPDDKTFTFKSNEIRFDLARSTAREKSLYKGFALDLNSLIEGRKDDDPVKKGFLGVSTDIDLAGVRGKSWYGLKYRANLGTPGELAGKINLDAYIVVAWATSSKGDGAVNAFVGLELPGTGGGAKLLDIQNVLKLSIGRIQLSYLSTDNAFLLMLNEIALKFLGLLKIPPGGSTNFFLFGNSNTVKDATTLGWFAMYKKQEA